MYEKKLLHFDWYKIDASFHQFLRLSINNDYGNLGSFIYWNGPHGKIPHFIMKWNEPNFEGVNKEVHSALCHMSMDFEMCNKILLPMILPPYIWYNMVSVHQILTCWIFFARWNHILDEISWIHSQCMKLWLVDEIKIE